MPATKRSQHPVQPKYGASHRAEQPGRAARVALIAVLGLGVGFVALTPPGVAAMSAVFRFLEFYSGVFSLVALSLTVMGGLAATDRMVLMVRHRVLLQGAHRSVATASVVFLAVHIVTKVVEGHAGLADVVIPFVASHRTFYVGLGTIASYLMIAVMVTGLMRGRFAGSARPWLWRTLHSIAYACWPIALLHGLNAGRAAKPWVTLSYVLCLIGVGLALMLRVWVIWTKQLRSPRTRTASPLKAVTFEPEMASSPPAFSSPTAAAPSGFAAPPAAATSAAAPPAAAPPAAAPPAPAPPPQPRVAADRPVGRWQNSETETITDEEFWAYLRSELTK